MLLDRTNEVFLQFTQPDPYNNSQPPLSSPHLPLRHHSKYFVFLIPAFCRCFRSKFFSFMKRIFFLLLINSNVEM